MKRNSYFPHGRDPMQGHPDLRLHESSLRGPFSFLTPTQARYLHDHPLERRHPEAEHHDVEKADTDAEKSPSVSGISYNWTSRNNRKGRHALVVHPDVLADPNINTPLPTTHWRKVIGTACRMLTRYPAYDISWDVAYIFTWGSVVWVINAFFAFLPLLVPSSEFHNEVYVGGGVTAFIGATIFEIGSVLLMLEAINENRESCFGWAVHHVFAHDKSGEHGGARLQILPDIEHCAHHHCNRRNLVGKPQFRADMGPDSSESKEPRSWQWWPATQELRTHYLRSIGFIACLSQLFGATIFWISGFTALPGIYNRLSPAALDGAYWFPQVLGGTGFIISGTLFMLETQTHWWKPALRVLGWHIGLWNLIGGVGFTLCPAFGFDTHSWAQYQASCSTFWGSWAFLIGSLLQLYEALEKNPVEVERE